MGTLQLLILGLKLVNYLASVLAKGQLLEAERRGIDTGQVRAYLAFREWVDGKVTAVELDRAKRVRRDPATDPDNRESGSPEEV